MRVGILSAGVMTMQRVLILGFLANGALGVDSSILESECWNQATQAVIALHSLRETNNGGVTIGTNPDKTRPCYLFDTLQRKAMALVVAKCRSSDRKESPDENERCGVVHELLDKPQNHAGDHGDQNGYAAAERLVVECISSLTPYNYHLYIEHLNHVENICFHIHSAMWQDRAHQLMNGLTFSADTVIDKLQQGAQSYEKILEKQDVSLDQQDKLIRSSSVLQKVIEGGNHRVQQAFDQMKNQVESEHEKIQSLFGDIFEGVNKLTAFQKYLKLKVLDIQTIALYGFLVFITQHLTSTARTQEARIPIFLAWTVLAFSEIFLLRQFEYDEELHAAVVFLSRCIFMFLSFCIWIKSYIYYEDRSMKALNAVDTKVNLLHHKMEQVLRTVNGPAISHYQPMLEPPTGAHLKSEQYRSICYRRKAGL